MLLPLVSGHCSVLPLPLPLSIPPYTELGTHAGILQPSLWPGETKGYLFSVSILSVRKHD